MPELNHFEQIRADIGRRMEELNHPLITTERRQGDPVSVMAYVGAPDWIYAEGYKLAGDAVVDQLMSGSGHTDYLVYPAVFMYRHCVEVMLKQICWTIWGYRRIEPSNSERDTVTGSHDLSRLWSLTDRALSQFGYTQARLDRLNDVKERILEIYEHDPRSTGFRYAQDRDMESSLPNLRTLNLAQLRRGADALWLVLDGILTEVEETWRMYEDARADNDYYNQP